MRTSIVMTTYNRPRQLAVTLASIKRQPGDYEIVVVDDGDDLVTPTLGEVVDKYVRLNRGSDGIHYRNQAIPLNVGIRMAEGDVLLIQNAECEHRDRDVIERLTEDVSGKINFARVVALAQDGSEWMEYCGEGNKRPYFFCGAVERDVLLQLRGFDEDFTGYGYEDDDMASRLFRYGLSFNFTNSLVWHQWHEPAGVYDCRDGLEMFKRKQAGPLVRNEGREWGVVRGRTNA